MLVHPGESFIGGAKRLSRSRQQRPDRLGRHLPIVGDLVHALQIEILRAQHGFLPIGQFRKGAGDQLGFVAALGFFEARLNPFERSWQSAPRAQLIAQHIRRDATQPSEKARMPRVEVRDAPHRHEPGLLGDILRQRPQAGAAPNDVCPQTQVRAIVERTPGGLIAG